MRRRDLPLLLVLSAASCASMDRCVSTPKAAIRDRVVSAWGYETNPVESDIRMGLCGFRPARTTKASIVGSPEVRLEEAGDHGTGQITAKVTLSTDDAPVCSGTLRFGYQYRPSRPRSPSYWEISDVARADDPPAIVKTIEKHANATKIGEAIRAFADESLLLPDGRVGTALAFDVTEPGPYTVRFDKKATADDPYVLAAYQKGRILHEGDGTGALGFFVFEAGKAILLASSPKVDPTDARVIRYEKR